MMKGKLLGVLIVALTMFGMASMVYANSIVYMRSTAGAPWGQSNNEQAMDGVFGAGNWDDLRYETVVTNTLFSGATSFIFMEGGDSTANELESFLGANQTALESWVSSGGKVLINSAPNEGNGMALGFGGIQLNYTDFSSNVTGVNPTHPIFTGPFGNTGSTFTGNQFGHATISGPGLTGLITNDANGNMVLAEKTWGAGYAMFGGMTTLNWQQPNAFMLRENILAYASDVDNAAAIPEPTTIFY